MTEYLSEPPNRWEQLSQGESSPSSDIARIAQFAGELELRSTKLPKNAPKDSSIVYRSLLDLLYVALQADILMYQRIKHFRDVGDKDEANKLPSGLYFIRMFSSNDIIPSAEGAQNAHGFDNSNEERLVFTTSREGWSHNLKAPAISGSRIGKKLRITISSTNDAANPYDSGVFPGINKIIIGEKGDMIMSGWRGHGESPKMNIVQKHLLANIFNNCKNELSGSLERSRKYFQQIQSSRSHFKT